MTRTPSRSALPLRRCRSPRPRHRRLPVSAVALAMAVAVVLGAWGTGCDRDAASGEADEVVQSLQRAIAARDGGAIWDLLADQTQRRVAVALDAVVDGLRSDEEAALAFGVSREEARGAGDRTRFAALVEAQLARLPAADPVARPAASTAAGEQTSRLPYELGAPVIVEGTRAAVELRTAAGQVLTLHLTVEDDGRWRLAPTEGCGVAATRPSGRAALMAVAWIVSAMLLLRASRGLGTRRSPGVTDLRPAT